MKKFLITEDEKKHIMKLYGLISEQFMNYTKPKDNTFFFDKIKNPDTSWKNRKLGKTPFTTKQEGDKFRKWVNDTYPDISKGLDLDISGEYNNEYIQWAWNLPVEVGDFGIYVNTTLGEIYLKNQDTKKTETPAASKSICPIIDENSNIQGLKEILNSAVASRSPIKTYASLNSIINMFAQRFVNQGIPVRTACQASLNKVRPNFKNKNQVIVDSLNKLIYIYDKDGNFIAKDVIISGAHKQSKDSEILAKAYLDFHDTGIDEGFKQDNDGNWIDTTGKGRKYTPDFFYDAINKRGTRFLPAGIYKTGELYSDEDYFAGEENITGLQTLGGKEIAGAIHTFYVEKPRIDAFNKAKQLISNPNNPNVSKEFLTAVNLGTINLSQSYGCINVRPEFLTILRQYIPNSYVFNISEDNNDYLVQNSQNFFDKTLDKPSCPNPKSFGAEQPIDFTV